MCYGYLCKVVSSNITVTCGLKSSQYSITNLGTIIQLSIFFISYLSIRASIFQFDRKGPNIQQEILKSQTKYC